MPHPPLWDELFDLSGRTAVVTGGNQGLGLVMAQTLAAAGAQVAVCGRRGAEAAAAADRIADATGRRTLGCACDVSRADEVRTLFERVGAELGAVDILVANAGINIRKATPDLTEADWDSVMGVNVKGAFLCARAVLPSMIERRWGRIVLLGSILSHISLPGRAAYASSKTALLGLARTLALEGAAHGVCVNALCPGPFATAINEPLMRDPEKNAEFIRNIPLGRWGDPQELRGLALLLCSPAAAFVTGADFLIDGGYTAR